MPPHSTLPDFDLPVTLYASRKKWFFVLLGCGTFVVLGLWMALDPNAAADQKVVGYVCAVFFGFGIPIGVVQLLPAAAYLRLDPQGFTYCNLFRKTTMLWSEVETFGVAYLQGGKLVGMNLADDHPSKGRMSALSQRISGFDGALSDTYGLSAEALASLMESLRLRSLPGSMQDPVTDPATQSKTM